jgi:hypothetical protein
MTRAELLAWARAYVAAEARYQAARAAVHDENTSREMVSEYRAARNAFDEAGTDSYALAEAIIEHFGKPARHFGRTRFDAPKEVV